jgi:hypothetical protein
MTKDLDQQLSFEFQSHTDARSSAMVEEDCAKRSVLPARIFSLAQHQAAKEAKELAAHFSEILNLVAHLK